MNKFGFISALLLLMIAGIVFADSLRLGIIPISSGTLPSLLSVLLSVLSIYLMVGSLKRNPNLDEAPNWPKGKDLYTLLYVGIATACYILITDKFGFIISTFLFVIVTLWKLSEYRWYKIFFLGIFISICTFLAFQKLGMSLPLGFWKNIYFKGIF